MHTDSRVSQPLVYLETPFSFIERFETESFIDLRDDEKETGSYELNLNAYLQGFVHKMIKGKKKKSKY